MWGGLTSWLYEASRSPSINWKLVFVVSALLESGFSTYVDWRQYKVQCRRSPPPVAIKEELTDEKTFKRSQEYSRAKLAFGIFTRVVGNVVNLALLTNNALPKVFHFWSLKFAGSAWIGEKIVGAITALSLTTFGSVLDLPLEYYNQFYLEERFGFNKSTVGLWIQDTLKSWLLRLLLLPILIAVQAIIEYFGDRFIPYMLLFVLCLSLFALVFVPVVVEPLFNNFKVLEEGELRTEIEKMGASLGFPLTRIYVVDGSRRSSHSNAYFTGFPWYKQIVIFDTLIKDQSTDEIVAVLAHELGHWKRNHMSVLLAAQLTIILALLSPLGLYLGNNHFFESLGFYRGETPIIGAVLMYADTLGPLSTALTFTQNFIVRACEYDADRFAVSLGKAQNLRASLIGLHKSNLSSVDHDRLYSTYTHSHPTLVERLEAISKEVRKIG